MAIGINDIIRINANFLMADTEEYTNVFHYKVTSSAGISDLDYMTSVAKELDEDYQIINLDISDELDYVDFVGQNLTKNELLPTVGWPVLVSGVDATSILPFQVAACVFFRTLRPKTRASKFVPGYCESSLTVGGLMKPAAITLLQSWGDSILSGIIEGGNVADYGAYNGEFDRFTPVTSAIVPTAFRTQRRRRVGVGQ